jgi:hypothetical protein
VLLTPVIMSTASGGGSWTSKLGCRWSLQGNSVQTAWLTNSRAIILKNLAFKVVCGLHVLYRQRSGTSCWKAERSDQSGPFVLWIGHRYLERARPPTSGPFAASQIAPVKTSPTLHLSLWQSPMQTLCFWDLKLPELWPFKFPQLLSFKVLLPVHSQWGLSVLFLKLTLFNGASSARLVRAANLWTFCCFLGSCQEHSDCPLLSYCLSMCASHCRIPCGHCDLGVPELSGLWFSKSSWLLSLKTCLPKRSFRNLISLSEDTRCFVLENFHR